VALTVIQKIGWLECQFDASVAASISLLEQLKAARSSQFSLVKTGQVVASTAANGQVVSFSEPGRAASSVQDMFGVCAEMVLRYNRSEQNLIDAGDSTPSDEDIKDDMVATMGSAIGRGVTSFLPDFSGCRTGA
jgi:hypothetical protein